MSGDGAAVLPWFLIVGGVLVAMAFASRWVARLPLSFSLLYLGVGFAIGPAGVGLLRVDIVDQAKVVEVLAEVAVLISLFAVGLRIRLPLAWRAWRTPLTLASVTMLATIAGIAAIGNLLLDLPWPAALLLGAVLAPTDPVLASDVQVRHPEDRDGLRVALTAEGGMNDGTAFPFVVLAIALLEGRFAPAHWLVLDVLWAIGAAVVLGAASGTLLARGVDRLRRSGTPLEFEEFLAFGAIAVTYGITLTIVAYGFIAVFVAGVAFARAEGLLARRPADGTARGAERAETASRLLAFTTQCERLAEVALVLTIGAALATVRWQPALLLFAVLVIVLVRPLAVLATVRDAALSLRRRRLLAWFGIRGIGSVYYLAHALHLHGPSPWAADLVDATLVTIAVSITVHGMSATPLMQRSRAAAGEPGA